MDVSFSDRLKKQVEHRCQLQLLMWAYHHINPRLKTLRQWHDFTHLHNVTEATKHTRRCSDDIFYSVHECVCVSLPGLYL